MNDVVLVDGPVKCKVEVLNSESTMKYLYKIAIVVRERIAY
jgi:hypothetical protein